MSAGAEPHRKGPLSGLKVVEMAGIGPVPLAGLMLADMGATVLRVARLQTGESFIPLTPEQDLGLHGRSLIRVDLKDPRGVGMTLDLIAGADVLMEGFRPGVMERLGLGPDTALARNPRLIYGRITGYGQDGPMAPRAGHDLNYLAMSGVLHAIGHAQARPVPPLNLVADYGGGTMFLIAGILAALFERGRSGKGQVVDATMLDGASMLASTIASLMSAGMWQDRRGSNLLDSGCPFYDTYETADDGHMAVACLEPQFFAEFCRLLPLDEPFPSSQYDMRAWPDMRHAIAAAFAQRTRDEWSDVFLATDACVTPVLSLTEAPLHPHNETRGSHVTAGTMRRPAPAPRFSRTQGKAAKLQETAIEDALAPFGVAPDIARGLAETGVIAQ